jgi:hypothetical protein
MAPHHLAAPFSQPFKKPCVFSAIFAKLFIKWSFHVFDKRGAQKAIAGMINNLLAGSFRKVGHSERIAFEHPERGSIFKNRQHGAENYAGIARNDGAIKTDEPAIPHILIVIDDRNVIP